MTVINSSPSSSTPCSLKTMYPSKKVTRLLWVFSIVIFISLWTCFLYLHTNISTSSHKSANRLPITFTQQKHTFDNSVIKGKDSCASIVTELQLILYNFLDYKILDHNRLDIESLVLDDKHNELQNESGVKPVADVTVFMRITEDDYLRNVKAQIKTILAQTVQPKHVYIFYNNEAIKKAVGRLVKQSNLHIKYFYTDSTNGNSFVRDAFWLLHHYSISTEYTWIMEPNTVPDHRYLHYTVGLLKSEEYKSTIIGYDASVLISNDNNRLSCIQSRLIEKTEQVDMIHNNWLLRTSWIQILKQEISNNAVVVLDLPIAYFISSSLLYRANIPSVAIPSKLKSASPSFCTSVKIQDIHLSTFNSVLPNVQDRQNFLQQQTDGRLVVLIDDVNNAAELLPLLCRLMNTQDKQLHIILANGLEKPLFEDALEQMECIQNEENPTVIHDLTMAYNNGVNQATAVDSTSYINPIVRLLEFLQPQVIIQVKSTENPYYFHSIQAAIKSQDVVPVYLDAQQIKHALWISDLSIEALRRKFIIFEVYTKLKADRRLYLNTDWNDIKIELVVITDRRSQSLARLLQSATEAHYLGDEHIEIVIHMEQSADVVTQDLVRSFEWKHGSKKIRHRIRKGGLMPAIVESWYPSDNNNYGVLLEDDIELSPLFYAWSKYNILKYRYSPNEENAYQHMYGVSLYSPRNLELLPEGRRPFNPESVLENSGYSKRAPYASQVPCSWGAVYFPEHWREFHAYLTARLAKEEWKGYHNITTPGSRSHKWQKSWKKYFIELVYLRAYVMMYPNFENFESFSTNHLEFGTHVKENGRTQSKVDQFMVPLMQRDTILNQLPNQRLPIFENLPLMDLWGNVRSIKEMDRIGSEWHQNISPCQRTVGTFNPADLLCPFDKNAQKFANTTVT